MEDLEARTALITRAGSGVGADVGRAPHAARAHPSEFGPVGTFG